MNSELLNKSVEHLFGYMNVINRKNFIDGLFSFLFRNIVYLHYRIKIQSNFIIYSEISVAGSRESRKLNTAGHVLQSLKILCIEIRQNISQQMIVFVRRPFLDIIKGGRMAVRRIIYVSRLCVGLSNRNLCRNLYCIRKKYVICIIHRSLYNIKMEIHQAFYENTK